MDRKHDFCLIAGSHGIAVLDAFSDWRSVLASRGNVRDSVFAYSSPVAQYQSPAFSGWYDGSMPFEPFSVQLTQGGLSQHACAVWMLSAAARTEIGPLASFKPGESGGVVLEVNPALIRVLEKWSTHVPIVSMLNGTEPASMMFNQYPEYDFIEEGATQNPGLQVLPLRVVDHYVDQWVNATLAPLLAIRKMSSAPLFHVMPPPPREEPQKALYQEGLHDIIRQHGFVSDALRLKWYRRYCRVLRQVAVGICSFIEVPSDALTGEGLLRAQYAEGLTHANTAYGALIGQRILSCVLGGGADESI